MLNIVANRSLLAVATFIAVLGHGVWAQDRDEWSAVQSADPTAAYRSPVQGIPVLNCRPASPAPENSCTVRLAPGDSRSALELDRVDDTPSDLTLRVVRADSSELTDFGTPASTIILLDLSSADNSARLRAFNSEREALLDLVEGFPIFGEIAIYGFGGTTSILQDFTASPTLALDAIRTVSPTAVNTQITDALLNAVEDLAARDDAFFRSVILISDGLEEGRLEGMDDVVRIAHDKGIGLSTVGVMWRGISDRQTSNGRSFLNTLVGQVGFGTYAEIDVSEGAAGWQDEVERFHDALRTGLRGSGLIVPQVTVGPAFIEMTTSTPSDVAGAEPRETPHRVRFGPAEAATPVNDGGEQEQSSAETGTVGDSNVNFSVYITGGAVAALISASAGFFWVRQYRQTILTRKTVVVTDVGTDETDPKAGMVTEPGHARDEDGPVAAPTLGYLEVQGTGEHLPIRSARTSVGRGSESDIQLAQDSVSRLHAELRVGQNGSLTVSDLNSKNKTYVNGRRIGSAKRLNSGDIVKFGAVETRFISS